MIMTDGFASERKSGVCVCVCARARRIMICGWCAFQILVHKFGPQEGEGFYVWVSVHHKLIYIKRTNVIQLGSVFICNCNIALHASDAFCVHLQECLETVVATSGE